MRWPVSRTQTMSSRELFREAAVAGLITDSAEWVRFHEARHATSHNYDQGNADSVFDELAEFAAAAEALLEPLKAHHA